MVFGYRLKRNYIEYAWILCSYDECFYVVTCKFEVRQIFKLNKAGNVAGSMVRDGRVAMRGNPSPTPNPESP